MNDLSYILDAKGEPVAVDMMVMARWLKADANRVVAKTVMGDVLVSTVFLGIDHRWGEGPPLLWETMVFGGPLSDEQVRYSSREDAEVGHTAMVDRCKPAAVAAMEGGTK